MPATKQTYKHIAAWFLLALYAFVATPVQFWHHHDQLVPKAIEANRPSDDHALLTAESGHSAIDCAICAHQYAAYNYDRSFSPATQVGFNEVQWPGLNSQALDSPKRLFSNKSPPLA